MSERRLKRELGEGYAEEEVRMTLIEGKYPTPQDIALLGEGIGFREPTRFPEGMILNGKPYKHTSHRLEGRGLSEENSEYNYE